MEELLVTKTPVDLTLRIEPDRAPFSVKKYRTFDKSSSMSYLHLELDLLLRKA